MGGSKNKSPAQKEKSQKDDKKSGDKKKGMKKDRTDGQAKNEISVIVNEEQAKKIIKSAKLITVHDFARQTGTKISAANAFLIKSMKNGDIKRVGGYSGHHVYQPVSG
jgi:small subunit ribosomal protein S25e